MKTNAEQRNMQTHADQRIFDRRCFTADISFSHFNKAHSYPAQTLNLSTGGMCFKSSLSLQPGAMVAIRLRKVHTNASDTGSCEGLRCLTLAEVRWCGKVPDDQTLPYGVGVRYFEPAY
jgi:hypothetical protein